MIRNTQLTLSVLLLAIGGCGLDADPDSTDEDSVESASTADDVSTFYSTRPDLRRCASPACGGSWVSRVNRPTTRCADGVHRAECYVAEIQNSTGLADDEWTTARGKRHIVRADMTTNPQVGTYGALRASEIWYAFDDHPANATFFQITDTQIRCITSPCFSLGEATLNSNRTMNLSGLSGRLSTAATEALGLGNIIVVGRNQRHDGGRVVLVDQLYLRAKPQSPMCAEYVTADGRFYARNFPGNQRAEAETWVAADPQVTASGISIGTCVAANAKPCDVQDPPVCGVPVVTDTASNYASLCEFRKVVRAFAGTEHESKGKFEDGVCREYCASAIVTTELATKLLYVQSFLGLAQAQAWLANTFPDVPESYIDPGLCGAQPTCTNPPEAPVCGTIRSEASSTYGSPCLFAAAVMQDAGASGSKGYWTPGACPAPAGWVTPLDVTIASLTRDANNYYELVVPAEATSVEITTTGGTGDVDLYVRRTVTPTEHTYDCRSWAIGNDEMCSFTTAPGGVTYKIMLNGYNLSSTDIELVARYYVP